MYSRWTTPVLILIPAFGLISCSQDKPEDSWKLKEPTIKVEGNSIDIPLSAAPSSIDAKAVLVFDKDDLKDVTLEFTSNCGNHQDKIEVRDVIEIPVASLWPRSAWQSLESKRFAELECSISAIAKNRNGSTHKFRLNTRKLANVGSFLIEGKSKIIKSIGGHSLPHPVVASNSEAYEIETDEGSPREIALKCENFANVRMYSTYEPAKEALKDLASSQIFDPLVRAANLGTRDPRQEKTLQNCMLVTRTQNVATGLPIYAATPEFTLEFPHPMAEVRVHLGAKRADQNSMRDQTLYSFELRNISDRSLRYRVPARLGSSVTMNAIIQPINATTFEMRKGFARTREIKEQTYVAIEGGQVRSTVQNLILDLPAKTTATLHLKMKSAKTCFPFFTWVAPVIPIDRILEHWSIAGLEMSFDQPIVIEQVRDFVGNEGLDEAQFIEIPLFGKQQSERAKWQPHDLWIRRTGSAAKPEVSETIVNPKLEGSFCIREGINPLNEDPANFF